MHLTIYKDHAALSLHAAETILEAVKENPAAVLCLATGDTPKLTYQLIAEKARAEKVDFSQCTFIGLDEWVSIPPQTEGSCRFALDHQLFLPLNIDESKVHVFDGMSADLAAECLNMDQVIEAAGGIDLMLVGVGMNGHIGFNEPGVCAELTAHVTDLDDTTLSVGQKYFSHATILKQGITLGLKQVLQSRKLLLLASGIKKATIIQKVFEGPITSEVPASMLRSHLHGWAVIDEDAAAEFKLPVHTGIPQ